MNVRGRILDSYVLLLLGIMLYMLISNYNFPLLSEWIVILFVAGLAVLFELRAIVLPSGEELTLISPLLFISGILYGFDLVFHIVLLSIAALILTKPAAWNPIIFNGTQYALSYLSAFWVYQLAGEMSVHYI